jgi:hypothetical protein
MRDERLNLGAGMRRFEGSRGGRCCGLVPALSGVGALLCFTAPALAGTKGDPNAVTFMVGRAVDTDFTQILTEPWTVDFVDLYMLSAAVSTRLGTLSEDPDSIGNDFSIDLEAGTSYRFGDEEMGEFWGAIYLRYDGFPWNDTIYTTIAANTGVSYITKTSEFERDRSDGQTSQLLHYLAPEITFADPDNKNVEWLIKLHHRSGVFGLFDGVTGGSTFIATGLRVRF